MTNLFKWLLPLALLMTTACTQAEPTQKVQAASDSVATAQVQAARDNTQSLIWQISKTGQPNSVLIGTVHIGKTNSQLPADFQTALQQSQQLVLETEAVAPEYLEKNPNIAMQLMATLMVEKSLNSTIGKKRIAPVQQVFVQSAMPEFAQLFAQPDAPISLAPWAIWFHLGYADTPAGYDFNHGIDMLLAKSAQAQNKPVLGLELLEPYQMLSQLPDDVAIRGIDSYLANRNKAIAMQAKLLRDYEQRNVADLWQASHGAAILEDIDPQDHAIIGKIVDEQILYQRNANWIPKLSLYLAQKPTLVAVGAAHLFGEKGVIALLRQQGYTVEPYKP